MHSVAFESSLFTLSTTMYNAEMKSYPLQVRISTKVLEDIDNLAGAANHGARHQRVVRRTAAPPATVLLQQVRPRHSTWTTQLRPSASAILRYR